MGRLGTLLRALTVQLLVLAVLWWLAQWLPRWLPPPYPLWAWGVVHGLLAAGLSRVIGLPPWWWIIQFLLSLAGWLLLPRMGEPGVAIAALTGVVGLWLVFRNAWQEGVPLYLSSRAVGQALCEVARRLPAPVHFLDLGCGTGTLLRALATCPPVVRRVGVETAWLPWLVARLRARGGEVYRTDLWTTPLAPFNLVYAFLSPVPMPALAQRIVKEMPPDSLFISNSFPMPDHPPTAVWQLQDRRGTYLYLYRFDERRRLVPPEEAARYGLEPE